MTRRDSLLIRTPEGIEFSLPLAGPVARMLALLVDLAVGSLLAELLEKLVAPVLTLTDATKAALAILLLVIYTAAAEWMWRGQTVGKRLFGLRVVDARGLRLEPSQVIVRNLIRFIDGLPALYLVGGIACFLHRHRRRLGDVAAGTVVVRTSNIAPPDLDQVLGSKYNSLAESRHLAARLRQKIPPEAAKLALETLIRRDRLDPEARLAVFAALASFYRELVPYPPEVVEQLSDEQYVRNVAAILYVRSIRNGVNPPSEPVR